MFVGMSQYYHSAVQAVAIFSNDIQTMQEKLNFTEFPKLSGRAIFYKKKFE